MTRAEKKILAVVVVSNALVGTGLVLHLICHVLGLS